MVSDGRLKLVLRPVTPARLMSLLHDGLGAGHVGGVPMVGLAPLTSAVTFAHRGQARVNVPALAVAVKVTGTPSSYTASMDCTALSCTAYLSVPGSVSTGVMW